MLIGLFVGNAVFGVLLYEYARNSTKRFRDGDTERDSKFPATRRLDAGNQTRCKFYAGAMTLLILRLLTVFFAALITTLLVLPISCTHNFRNGPLPDGCRKSFIDGAYRCCAAICTVATGLTVSKESIELDYSEYLGADYLSKYRDIKKTSMIVSNHVGFLDPFVVTQFIKFSISV